VNRALRIAAALACAVVALRAAGCYPEHPEPWGFLRDRPPPKITEWGLQQTESMAIAYAFLALRDSLAEDQTDADRRATMDGLVAIQQKLIDGWPGYSFSASAGVVNDARAETARKGSIRNNYQNVAKEIADATAEKNSSPATFRHIVETQRRWTAAYVYMEPSPTDAEAHALWLEIGKREGVFDR
jgi:hypothetical protein